MFADLVPLYPMLVPFLLVLFRVVGIFVFVPVLSNAAIPGNLKVLLGLAITVCIWNVVPRIADSAVPQTLIGLSIAVAGEMSVGLLIGMMVGGVFAGIQLGAHLVSQQMGLSLATIYDPGFEDQSTVVEQVAFWIALVVFLVMGGHREIINSVVYSYKAVPMGQGGISPQLMLNAILGSMDSAFHGAMRVGMPALAAFFVATMAAGLMSRSMPQMNLMTMGVSINLIVGFIMVMVGIAGWALVAQDNFRDLFNTLGRFFG